VAAARVAAGVAGLGGVRVERADAGDLASYVGAVPADLVLLVGVFGNTSDADVRGTVEALPELCGPGATVIWTRGRRAPDLTPAIRRWLTDSGFVERAFHAPDDALFSVGVHRFTGRPDHCRPAARCSASSVDARPWDRPARRRRAGGPPARQPGGQVRWVPVSDRTAGAGHRSASTSRRSSSSSNQFPDEGCWYSRELVARAWQQAAARSWSTPAAAE